MNKREFTRSAFSMEARLFSATCGTVTGQVANVSLYGIYLRTADTAMLEQKKLHRMSIHLGGEHSEIDIDCQATVAHTDENGLGLHIEGLTVDAFRHWKNFVANACQDTALVENELTKYVHRNLANA